MAVGNGEIKKQKKQHKREKRQRQGKRVARCENSNKTHKKDVNFSYKMVDYLKKALIYGHTSRISS